MDRIKMLISDNEASQVCFDSIKIEPLNPKSYKLLGDILLAQDKYMEALRAYTMVARLNSGFPCEESLYKVARHINSFSGKQELLKLAIESYRCATWLNLRRAEVHFLFGETFKRLEYYQDAVSEFRQALSSNPIFVEAQTSLNDSLQALKLPSQKTTTLVTEEKFCRYIQEYFYNKSVAIVGSSPRILNNNYGSCIDSHDLVIRFNNAEVKGFESHVGRRTSMRFALAVYNTSEHLQFIENLIEEKSVIITRRENLHQMKSVTPKNLIVLRFDIHYFAFKIVDHLLGTEYKKQKTPPVRSGLATLLYLIYAAKDIKRISIFGMERQIPSPTSPIHFYGKPSSFLNFSNTMRYKKAHISLDEEMQIFNSILDTVEVIEYEPKFSN
jgi:tetratricopeptide (TPR) repeat protein